LAFFDDEVKTIQAEGGEIESVEEFCYLGSVVSRDSSGEKKIKIRPGMANATFGRLSNVWKSKSLKLKVKIRLYESLVLATLRYGSETWSMTLTNSKKLKAAHHKYLRRIVGITWKQRITNEELRQRMEWA